MVTASAPGPSRSWDVPFTDLRMEEWYRDVPFTDLRMEEWYRDVPFTDLRMESTGESYDFSVLSVSPWYE